MSILNNTTLLNSLLEKVNNLPEPSEPENLDEELSAQSTLISEQDAKIAELAEVLAGKASGGGGGSSDEDVTYVSVRHNLPEDFQFMMVNGVMCLCGETTQVPIDMNGCLSFYFYNPMVAGLNEVYEINVNYEVEGDDGAYTESMGVNWSARGQYVSGLTSEGYSAPLLTFVVTFVE